jgi:predicted nucleic acid-binding protein
MFEQTRDLPEGKPVTDAHHRRRRQRITEHVVHEVTQHYPDQLSRLTAALAEKHIEEIIITELPELQLMAELHLGDGRSRLGIGECSAIAFAIKRGYALGIDDRAAAKAAKRIAPALEVRTTQEMMVSLIQLSAIDVVRADAIKETWEKDYRFRLKIASFSELL